MCSANEISVVIPIRARKDTHHSDCFDPRAQGLLTDCPSAVTQTIINAPAHTERTGGQA